MQLEHSFTVPVGIDEAWRVLIDIGSIAPCMPGSKIAEASTEHAAGTLKVKLGPLNLNYKGSARLVESDPAAHRAVIAADGEDARNGSATTTVVATLDGDAETTTVALVTDLEVTGKPAQFAHGVMADVGTKVVGQFATTLAAAIKSASLTASGESAEVSSAAAETPKTKPRPKPRKAAAKTPPPVKESVPSVEEPAPPVEDPVADPPPAEQSEAAADAAIDEPSVDEAAVEAPSAEAAGRSFAAPSQPTARPAADAIPSVNGHGSPTPPPPSSGGLAGLARPAMVRGVAPAALAVLIVVGALRRRRHRRS